MEIKKIEWKVTALFSCFCCRVARAEYKVTLPINRAGSLTVCLCNECIQKTETELLAHFNVVS